MTSTRRNARVAGLLYLLLAITAPVRLMVIPSALFVRGDATATAANIAARESLFRLGIVADLLAATLLLFLVLALHRLFEPVDRRYSVLVVILGGLMVTPIYFLNALNDAAALLLVRGADFLSVFDQGQRDALALLFLRLHHQGVLVNEIFWGLWLFPLGALVYKSGFLPRFLAVWLFLNGLAYLALSLTGLLLPQHEDLLGRIAFPALLGELVTLLWLLVGGAKPRTASA